MSSIATLPTMANVARTKEICEKVKQLALKPTPWTLSNLKMLGLSTSSAFTKRLEYVFLRFLYQCECALISQSSDNDMRRYYKVYCHCPECKYFHACLQNACKYFVDDGQESSCCFELVESIADATIIFALFPNVDSLYSKTVNEYGDTTISHVFCDLSKSESKDSKIYFLLYGDSECLNKPTSKKEMDERSLDALRVDMHLGKFFRENQIFSLEPIKVEFDSYVDGRYESECIDGSITKKQLSMLNGGDLNHIMQQCESWHVCSNNSAHAFIHKYDELFMLNNAQIDDQDGGRSDIYRNTLLNKLSPKLQGFHEDLVEWGRKQLAKWDNDPIFRKKHLEKFVTRRRFESYLDVKVQKKFLKTLEKANSNKNV